MLPRRAVLPGAWTVWPCQPTDGPTNMATDAALLACASPDLGVWRWYGWSAPTISFGRNERTAGRYSPASVAAAGLTAVRRPTGGRALLHAREITYSVTCGLAPEFGWREAYEGINRILLAALRALGAGVERVGAQPAVVPDGPMCFDMPAEGELVVAGRKLVGSAVWRHGARYLQHGSILLYDDQALLTRASTASLPAPPPAAALLESLGTVTRFRDEEAVRGALDTALRFELSRHADVTGFTPSASLLGAIAAQRDEFTDQDRLWRR